MKNLKNDKGITLVALVVTVVVLLILSTVSIKLTIGGNGLITESKLIKQNIEEAEHEDALEDDINEAPSLRDTPNSKNEPTKSFAQAKAQPNDADDEDDEDDLSSFTL